MTKFATASQWYRIDPDRRAPREVSLPLSSREGGEVVSTVKGCNLRRAE
jgi:hypothetical protein